MVSPDDVTKKFRSEEAFMDGIVITQRFTLPEAVDVTLERAVELFFPANPDLDATRMPGFSYDSFKSAEETEVVVRFDMKSWISSSAIIGMAMMISETLRSAIRLRGFDSSSDQGKQLIALIRCLQEVVFLGHLLRE